MLDASMEAVELSEVALESTSLDPVWEAPEDAEPATSEVEDLAMPGSLANDATALDAYRQVLAGSKLLTAEEEVVLALDMRAGREAVVEAIVGIPLALSVFAQALEDALAGRRRLADVLHSPYGSFGVEDGTEGGGRELHAAAARFFAAWHDEGGDEAARLEKAARELRGMEPGLVILDEALGACRALDRQAHASQQAGEASPRGGTLADLRRRAGVELEALHERVREGSNALARYRRGHEKMVHANLRLAFSMARKYQGNGVLLEDLVQAANLGVIRAAEKFDPDLGYKFSTYASQWIRQALSKSVADQSRTIRVAAHMHETIVRLNRLSRAMRHRLGREPTTEELAQEADISVARIKRALTASQHIMSLDAQVPGLDDVSYQDLLAEDGGDAPEDSCHDDELSAHVDTLLQGLPEREAYIVRMRHGIGGSEAHTLEQIGAMLGITRERTRQLEARAMKRLRARAQADLQVSLAQ